MRAHPRAHDAAARARVRHLAARARRRSRRVCRRRGRRQRAGVADRRGERGRRGSIERVEELRALAEERRASRRGHELMTLDDLRHDIDRVDEVLVRLLNERARVRLRDRPAEEGAGHRGLSAGSREAGAARTSASVAAEGPLGAGRDRAAVRAHHRRSAPPRAARRARRARADDRQLKRRSRADGSMEATEAMVVVMEERATEAQIEQVVARLVEMGMDVHRSTGVTRTVLGAVGQGHPDDGADRDARRRARSAADLRAVQAREPHVQAGGHGRHASATCGSAATKSSSWPARARPRPSSRCATTAAAVQAGRREDLPRRRVQAAQLAVQLPGPRRGGPAAAARRRRTPRT